MLVEGTPYRTIWPHPDDPAVVQIIDQRHLPFRLEIEDLRSVDDVAIAIRDMHVRGAGLIGATAAWGMYLASLEAGGNADMFASLGEQLIATRPTAVNLGWAVRRQIEAAGSAPEPDKAREVAQAVADEDAACCRAIGEHGLLILQELAKTKRGEPVQILTHCNAGWLAFVDYGSATSPIYAAFDVGIPVHVWVDETRPRNQGARLTAWELGMHGVPHTVIADNAGGHLMQRGEIDVVITGTDRTTRTGDVANKIGTYLKALAAGDNGIPFYVALPSSTFDWETREGQAIPIEERDPREVTHLAGWSSDGAEREVRLTPETTAAANPAFDVTPSRLVTGLITERGVCAADEDSILELFPEQRVDAGRC